MASKPVKIPENPLITPFVPAIGPPDFIANPLLRGQVKNSGWIASTGNLGVRYVRQYFDPMMPPEDLPPTTVIPPGGILFPAMQALSQPTIAFNLDPSSPINKKVPADSGLELCTINGMPVAAYKALNTCCPVKTNKVKAK